MLYEASPARSQYAGVSEPVQPCLQTLPAIAEPSLSASPFALSIRLLLSLIGSLPAFWIQVETKAASPSSPVRVIMVTGDAPPNRDGRFRNTGLYFSGLNARGEVAFVSDLIGTSRGGQNDSGLFIGDGTTLRELAREGDRVPEGDANFDSFTTPQGYLVDIVLAGGLPLNARGQTVFGAHVRSESTLSGRIYRSDPAPDRLSPVARAGMPAPQGNGTLGPGGARASFEGPVINSSGAVAFSAYIKDTTNDMNGWAVVFSAGDQLSLLVAPRQLDRSGQFTVTGNVRFGPVLDDFGGALFRYPHRGFYEVLSSAQTSGITVFGYPDQPTLDGLGSLVFADPNIPPAARTQEHVAFVAQVQGLTAAYESLFVWQNGELHEMARTAATPEETRWRFGKIHGLDINAAGQLVFENLAAGVDSSGIFRSEGSRVSLRRIVADKQAAPDGRGILSLGTSERKGLVINEAGQVAFASPVWDSSVPGDQGVFLVDPAAGLIQVARTGQALLGSTISTLALQGTRPSRLLANGPQAREFAGLNDAGDVAFMFELTDARVGIAVWSYSEFKKNLPPTSLVFATEVTSGQTLQLSVSNLLSVVSDPEGGAVYLTSVSNPTSQGRTFSYNSFSGTYTYSPAAGFVGVDDFHYLVRDELGASHSVSGHIIVVAANQAPTATALTVSVRAGHTLSLPESSILAVVNDPDGDPLMLALVPTTTRRGGDITREGAVISIRPSFASGTDSFDVSVEDGRGGKVSVRVNITETGTEVVVNGFSRMSSSPGRFVFSISSGAATWTIERAENLHGPWLPIGRVTIAPSGRASPTGTSQFVDEQPPASNAYYRAVR